MTSHCDHGTSLDEDCGKCRETVERMKREGPMPARPVKPTRSLSNGANDRQARQHYSMMLDYWIEESKWWELRAKRIEGVGRRLLEHVEHKDEARDSEYHQKLRAMGDLIAVNEGNLWALLMELNS